MCATARQLEPITAAGAPRGAIRSPASFESRRWRLRRQTGPGRRQTNPGRRQPLLGCAAHTHGATLPRTRRETATVSCPVRSPPNDDAQKGERELRTFAEHPSVPVSPTFLFGPVLDEHGSNHACIVTKRVAFNTLILSCTAETAPQLRNWHRPGAVWVQDTSFRRFPYPARPVRHVPL
jgi:hypothetical protein